MSTRMLAATVLGLGMAGCMSNGDQVAMVYAVGQERRVSIVYAVIVSTLGAVALAAGVIALATASEAMLVTLVAAVVALWVISTIRHAITAQPPLTDLAAREQVGEPVRAGRR